MTDFGPGDIFFVGKADSTSCWYRCAVPAMALGAEWAGVIGDPGRSIRVVSGTARSLPDPEGKVVVVQQPSGERWWDYINHMRDRGAKVLYEVDDWLDSVGYVDHEHADHWTQERVDEHYLCMSACDAIIVSTPWLKESYSYEMGVNFIKSLPIFVCRTGLDLGRYEVSPTKPRRHLRFGWAGGVGHRSALEEWKPAIHDMLEANADTSFVCIGSQHLQDLDERFADRVLRVPYTTIENYPAALRNIDVMLAPAVENDFFRGKSDLRFLEASALGIPGVYDYGVYGSTVDDGETGFVAATPQEAHSCMDILRRDPETRREIGERARQYVLSERSIASTVEDWIGALEEVV